MSSDATTSDDVPAPADELDPHWHMPTDGCDHRTFACHDCCPHGDDAS